MKLGFVSAILENYSFEEVVDFASLHQFECIEMACWPKGKAQRRYAGVTHIDIDQLEEGKIQYIKEYCRKKNVTISALAYYPNTLDPNLEKRKIYVEHLKKLIVNSRKLNVGVVTTFIGRDQTKTVEENIETAVEVFQPIIELAEREKVKIAIENCPMLFTNDQWPGGQNLMTTPDIWRKMFDRLPSEYFGLNYDPSHFVWQRIDYIKPLFEFKDKIFHVHYKDIKVYQDKLDEVGIMATPLQYMSPKLPGLGDIDWGKYVSALTDIGYDRNTCIEIEDKAFEGSEEKIQNSLLLSQRYLRQFVI